MAEKRYAMISQPMNGLEDYQIKATKAKATKALETKGYEVLNTLFEGEWANNDNLRANGFVNIPVAFLAKSIESMAKCDAVYFCDGWEKARGCIIEHQVAQTYGLDVFYETPTV